MRTHAMFLATLLACACRAPAELPDAGEPADAGGDAGEPADAGSDAGVDAPVDAGPLTVTFLTPDGGAVTTLIYSLPFHVRVDGVLPGASVQLVSRLQNLQASSTYVAGSDHAIDTARDAPSAGSYTGVDPEGPIWSLLPGSNGSIGNSFDVQVEASDGVRTATARLARPGMGTGTTRVNVASGEVRGTFWKQTAAGQRPAVLVLGGSECDLGATSFIAAWITTLGYHALAVDYCDAQGFIRRIPLERLEAALDWLAARPEVDATRLGVYGASRGGELALQLAAIDARPQAVVAVVPSGYRWGDTKAGDDVAWTLADAGLPAVPDSPSAMPATETLPDGGLGYRFTPMFLQLLAAADPRSLALATIPVGAAHARLLLVGAEDDALWPSCRLVADAWATLTDAGHTGDEQLCLPNAGHLLGPPGWSSAEGYAAWDPSLGASMVFGGTPEGRGRADRALDTAWRQFFRRVLGEP
ncbi:MAG: acyl-CoA thioesterase/BAAT N-terminal domain-containing protein [Archangiaceae bacterium]|nr:acyl-CoA thioesterase/BAAT N-terminal domain-containing protein [Archangiaceae bacterium]